ncbi:MAG: GGDEF domain-containing protein [Alphaproteobacteria bacterium]|nr:GGDEF domain-containing protein [Alphaproteobacteria bacterium]
MSPPIASAQPMGVAIPNIFAGFASRLQRMGASARPRIDDEQGDSRLLIERLLAYATNAERQLLEQKRRIAELEALSMTDETTGLANRRAFEDFLARTLARAARHGETGVLAYLDLDNFKQINDRHGHAAGDAALRHVARLLQSSIRTSDLAARLHGDEFAVLLVRAGCEQGRQRIDAIARTLRRTPFRFAGQEIALAASAGIACYDGPVDRAALVAAADADMYRQKRHARAPA